MSKYFFLPDGIIQPSVIYTQQRGNGQVLIIKNDLKEFVYKLKDEKGWTGIITAIMSLMMKPFNDDIISLIACLKDKIDEPLNSTTEDPTENSVTETPATPVQQS